MRKPTNNEMQLAYNNGHSARREGTDNKSNPYSIVSESTLYHQWIGGWNDADIQISFSSQTRQD